MCWNFPLPSVIKIRVAFCLQTDAVQTSEVKPVYLRTLYIYCFLNSVIFEKENCWSQIKTFVKYGLYMWCVCTKFNITRRPFVWTLNTKLDRYQWSGFWNETSGPADLNGQFDVALRSTSCLTRRLCVYRPRHFLTQPSIEHPTGSVSAHIQLTGARASTC
jgi:hypothetical protein